jgi:hypothetical protein
MGKLCVFASLYFQVADQKTRGSELDASKYCIEFNLPLISLENMTPVHIACCLCKINLFYPPK